MSVSAICGTQSLVRPDENVFCLEVGLTGKLHGELFGGEVGSLPAGLQCFSLVRKTLFVSKRANA
jgi:hypothetical protein